jgi:regulator of RNase E activity RraA
MSSPTPEQLAQLTAWDTPTICNGLEIVCPERRATGFTTVPMVSLDPSLPPVIGYARTARIRATAPNTADAETARTLRMDYYDYVATGGPTPSIVVIEDLDTHPGYGAFWGEVNTTIHKGLGVAGAVTNGSIRDLQDSAKGFQLLAGCVGPSHAHVHLVDFSADVTVHNMSVSHGDIVHADCHGAVVIPEAAVAQLPAAIDLISRREAEILNAARADDFNIEKLRAAMASAGEIH